MSGDTNAKVFARLETILKVSGILNVYSDQSSMDRIDAETQEALLPAVFLLIGKEERRGAALTQGFNQRVPPQLMVILPEVWVVLMPRENPVNLGVSAELRTFRRLILKAVTQDEQLILMLGDSGQIEYRGYETDMQSGGEMVGQMRLDFAFIYMFDADD